MYFTSQLSLEDSQDSYVVIPRKLLVMVFGSEVVEIVELPNRISRNRTSARFYVMQKSEKPLGSVL